MGAAITKQELKRMLRDRPTKRDLRATLDDALKDYPTKRELKRDLGNVLHHYATKRDLMLVKRDLNKAIAKRISESEDWSERVFATNERIDQLEGNMIHRFNETDGKIDALEHRMVDGMEAMEQRIIGAMQAVVTQVTAKLTPKDDHRRLEKRVAVLERKST